MNGGMCHRLLKNHRIVKNDKLTWSKLSRMWSNINVGFHTSSTSRKTSEDTVTLSRYNPISELQPFMAEPIIPVDTIPFNPLETEIEAAKILFTPKPKSHEIRHIKTTVNIDKLPTYNIPEVAFIGRSNVGKSSLIRTLFPSVPELHKTQAVSSKPGRTKALTLYQAGQSFTLVDMPGYGYHMPKYFTTCVEAYLQHRKNLAMVFILIDGEVGMTPRDTDMLEKLQVLSPLHCMVLTKIDKTKRHKLLKTLISVMAYRDSHTKYCTPQPFLVSSHTGEGIELLQTFIAYVTGNLKVTGS